MNSQQWVLRDSNKSDETIFQSMWRENGMYKVVLRSNEPLNTATKFKTLWKHLRMTNNQII